MDRDVVSNSLEKKLSLRSDVQSLRSRNILREGTEFPHMINQHLRDNLPVKKEKLEKLVHGADRYYCSTCSSTLF